MKITELRKRGNFVVLPVAILLTALTVVLAQSIFFRPNISPRNLWTHIRQGKAAGFDCFKFDQNANGTVNITGLHCPNEPLETPTATQTVTATATNTPTVTATVVVTKTPTLTPTQTATSTVTPTNATTLTPTATFSSTPTSTATMTATNTPANTPTPLSGLTCDFYAAVNGTASGNGSQSNPWALQTALNKTALIVAGKTLCLQDGVYRGKFKSTLNGGTVRGLGGAVIDGYVFSLLTADITASQTSITVVDASIFVPAQQAGAINTLIVDGEALFINYISGNTINVNRAASGSSTGAVAHNAGALVRLAGNQLSAAGSNTTYQDIEILNSDPRRDWRYDGAEGLRGAGIFNTGNGNKFVNLNIHDNLNGIFSGSSSSNSEFYGNLIYNNGMFDGTSEGKGHGMYLENSAGYSRVYSNVVFNNFGLGAQLYGRTATYFGGDIQGNVFANSGSPVGAGVRHQNLVVGPESQRIIDILVKDNVFMHPMNAGYNVIVGYGAGVGNGQVLDNYFIGSNAIGLEIVNTSNITATGNKFYVSDRNIQTTQGAFTINGNTYYGTSSTADKFGNVTAQTSQNFPQWKSATGYDAGSTATNAAIPDTVIVRPNNYQLGRANIIVISGSGANSVSVNLANTGLSIGQSFAVVNAFGGNVVFTGVFDGSPITLSLSNAVAQPISSIYSITSTSPLFGVYTVRPL